MPSIKIVGPVALARTDVPRLSIMRKSAENFMSVFPVGDNALGKSTHLLSCIMKHA